MEEQMNQPMLMPNCLMSEMLEKVFSIPRKSKMLVISIIFLMILPFCLLILMADLAHVCIMVKILSTIEVLVNQKLSGSEAKKLVQGTIESVWFLFGVQVFLMTLFCISSVICLVLNGVNLKNILPKIGGQWRIRHVISWFRITVLIVFTDVIVLISVSLLVESGIDLALILSGLMVVVLGTICCLYLGAVWMFSVVMSITEVHTSETVVFETSIEGRRLQGFVLTVCASILSTATMVAFAFERKKDGRGTDALLAKWIMMLCYVCVLKFFVFVLYSVYCYESKTKNREPVDVEDRSGYSPIVIDVV